METLEPQVCGARCARFDDGARDCLLDLVSTDPDYFCRRFGEDDDCAVSDPGICHAMCDALRASCSGSVDPMWWCYSYCKRYMAGPIACAFASLYPDPECTGAVSCLQGHLYGKSCDEVCRLAEMCGLGVEHDACVDACSTLGGDDMSLGCIQTAAVLGDCAALADCGGLVP
jgi:hypothetical protein